MVCAVIPVPGDLSHALAVRRAHPDPDGFPESGVIGRLHARRLGPLVDGSDRADNFPDSGGRFRERQAQAGCFLRTTPACSPATIESAAYRWFAGKLQSSTPTVAAPSKAPRPHSVAVGCGRCRRGGIGTAQQGIEPGVELGQPLVLAPHAQDLALERPRALLDRVHGSPVEHRQELSPPRQR